MQANGMEAALGGEDKHTEPLHDGTRQVMGAMAELMLNGTLARRSAATRRGESGRCVDLRVRSDLAKRVAAKPNTACTLFADRALLPLRSSNPKRWPPSSAAGSRIRASDTRAAMAMSLRIASMGLTDLRWERGLRT
ncbi:hypothetical protein [Sphingomonas sp. ERG5]|uniref:hypothetical protein n=1 Tax=Sphingomonas sp. ERG5 TaxID=1381597 RepID=UPI00054BA1BC|nr:hypothetical protein [Sphingomonas sp. ERG5]